jgi:hypothetical protein
MALVTLQTIFQDAFPAYEQRHALPAHVRRAAHAFQPASTSGASCLVIRCVSKASCRLSNTCNRLALRRGQRVRDSCSCQYISGNKCSPTHLFHIGVRTTCCPSCHTLL